MLRLTCKSRRPAARSRRWPATPNRPDSMRALALEALDQLNDPRLASRPLRGRSILPGARSRTAALRLLAKIDPAAAIAPLKDRLENGSTLERQGAIAILAAMPGEAARRLLSDWLDRLIAGKASPEIQLDLLEAAAKRSEPEFREKIKKYESTKRRDDPLVGLSRGARRRRPRARPDALHLQGRRRVRSLPQGSRSRRRIDRRRGRPRALRRRCEALAGPICSSRS